MMMRKRSAGFQNLVAPDAFQFQINLLRFGHTFVIEPKIKVDTDSRPVYLSHPSTDEWFTGKSSPRVFLRNPPFNVVTQGECLTPRYRRFERFRDDVVIHQEVADIGDAVSQLVPAAAVFRAGFHATVLCGNAVKIAFLSIDFRPRTLEYQRTDTHFVRVELFDLRHEKLFCLALQIC